MNASTLRSAAGAQQQDDHAGSPAPSEPVGYLSKFGHFFNPQEHAAWIEAFGPDAESIKSLRPVFTHPAPSAQSSKAALSDDEIDAVFSANHNSQDEPWVNWRRFARAILARAGITRKPLTLEQMQELVEEFTWFDSEHERYDIQGFARAVERFHGITPQAGKESGDAS